MLNSRVPDHGDHAAALSASLAALRSSIEAPPELTEFALACLLGSGHLLLEGQPGTGKTALAKRLARLFGGSFRRIQMTSDLLPSDIVGVIRLRPGTSEFEFRPGPIFSNFVLADELNRTSPKTQSALLEAMAESTVTVDGVTYELPRPFFLIATQNPLESQGVYPLAESQLDRFTLKLEMKRPGPAEELRIYEHEARGHAAAGPVPAPSDDALTLAEVEAWRAQARRVLVERSVLEYGAELVRRTGSAPGVTAGASVRAGLQLLACARALALIRGRDFVVPEDLRSLAGPALAHRLQYEGAWRNPLELSPDLARERRKQLDAWLDQVPAPV